MSLPPLPLAYLDPGTGSVILQAIIGAVIGALVMLKVYWHKVKAVFSRKKPAAVEDGASDALPASEQQKPEGT